MGIYIAGIFPSIFNTINPRISGLSISAFLVLKLDHCLYNYKDCYLPTDYIRMKAHFCSNQMLKLKTVKRQIDRESAEKIVIISRPKSVVKQRTFPLYICSLQNHNRQALRYSNVHSKQTIISYESFAQLCTWKLPIYRCS